MKKLIVFDFDSTLCDVETIDEIAKEINIKKQIESITTEAMNGRLSFFESLIKRVSLLKGIPFSRVREICHSLPLTNGAKECVKELKSRDYTVVVFSGGFRVATNHYAKILGLDADFSNMLSHGGANDELDGLCGGEMMFDTSKGIMIQKLQSILNIGIENTVAIGDGANDLSMFEYSKTKIAFCAKPILRENATNIIEKRDLMEVCEIIK